MAVRKIRPRRKMNRRPRRKTTRAPTIHKFTEMYKDVSIGAGTGSFSSGVLAVSGLNSLLNVTNYQGLFDLYKITGVTYKFVPAFNQADVGTSSQIPNLYLATNRSPFVPAPVSVGDILNDDTCRVYRLDRPITWSVSCPKPDMSSQVTIGESSYSVPHNWQFAPVAKYQPWLTTGGNSQTLSQIALKHYGVKWAVDNLNTVAINVDVYTTIHFQMKEQD